MKIELPFENEVVELILDVPPDRVKVAKSPNPKPTETWEKVAEEALRHPLNSKRLSQFDLKGKKVVIITDDKGRPTPAYRVIPSALKEVKAAGAEDGDITFMTASGMHETMTKEELEWKLGKDIVANYRAISHDGGDRSNLTFYGFSPLGTPIWVNSVVASADFRVAIGRIYLHETHGYEGGYKIILPGVSAYESIVRDHSMNFSPDSIAGIHKNPSRDETDRVGEMVGVDFVVNIVVNHRGEPFKGFAGEPYSVHHAGIEYGDRSVWGAEVGGKFDIVIASPGPEKSQDAAFSTKALSMASFATKPGGTTILLAGLNGKVKEFKRPDDPFRAQLSELSLSDLVRLHEKRNWGLSDKEIQFKIKTIRGEFYLRRVFLNKEVVLVGCSVPEKIARERLNGAKCVSSLDEAVRYALEKHGAYAKILVLPEATSTLPLEKFHKFQDALAGIGSKAASRKI